MRRKNGTIAVCGAAMLLTLAVAARSRGTERGAPARATRLVAQTSGGAKAGTATATMPAAKPAPTTTRIGESQIDPRTSDETAPNGTTETGEKTLSTRVVAYQIEARLDPAKHTVAGSETLTYRNLTGQPQQTFPFHLYLNAFQPQSTWMTEVHLNGTRGASPGEDWNPKHFGSITVKKLDADGAGDLTDQIKFIHPDDGNALDRTVFQVTLPKAVAPGASATFHIVFDDVMPEVVERTGYHRDFYMVGQWFPKVGVWWKGAWNCHQFHATTEFFSDFGTYDVKITVPQNEIVGAGGDLTASATNADGTKTLEYKSEDVHDFSWTASPHFTLVEDSWTGSAGVVKIHLLMSPGHMGTKDRYLAALKGTLRKYDEWIGPYPYDRITVVDPPEGGMEAGGMEYPTLITAGTSWFSPRGVLLPEIVLEHEFGHQYWYGMVATNEFEEAWLDEGINSYMEVKVMDALYGKRGSMLNFPFIQMSEDGGQRAEYLALPDTDPIARLGWKFMNSDTYGGITYGKTSTVLLTLENIVGPEKMRAAMHEYFLRYRFKHPTGEDFLKTIEDVTGQNLRWYFDQAVSGTNVMDYSIEDAHSEPVQWWNSKRGSKSANDGSPTQRTYVTVRRNGDFVAPVDVLVEFANGEKMTEHWDGQDRWIRYEFEGQSELASATVDPHQTLTLDRNFYNNSYVVKSDDRGSRKLNTLWMFASEWLSQITAWLT
ncbi:MAG: M1 family metallopeptidase [Candidatus Acidiferrales bacterium]